MKPEGETPSGAHRYCMTMVISDAQAAIRTRKSLSDSQYECSYLPTRITGEISNCDSAGSTFLTNKGEAGRGIRVFIVFGLASTEDFRGWCLKRLSEMLHGSLEMTWKVSFPPSGALIAPRVAFFEPGGRICFTVVETWN